MTFLKRITKTWHPASFQGAGKRKNYFEGWLYKLVDASRENVLAIIPGVFLGEKKSDSHAFVQILDGRTHQSTYHKFRLADFKAFSDKLYIKIGNNHFTEKYINLELSDYEREVAGQISLFNLYPWPVKFLSPGAMGWYSFVPFMECYHGIISMDHSLEGSVKIDGKEIIFDDGRGYTEKDWGRSFPQAYVWIQSNHFDESGISLSASIARIPWLGSAFRGFIIGLLVNGRLYRFTTYNDAHLNFLTIDNKNIRFEVSDKKQILYVEATKNEGGLLHAPYNFSMINRISESLKSEVFVKLFLKDTEHIVFEGCSTVTALEINGNLKSIMDE
jgi:tocopherol cyclase